MKRKRERSQDQGQQEAVGGGNICPSTTSWSHTSQTEKPLAI